MSLTRTAQLGDITLVVKNTDDYVNVTLLCQTGGKVYRHWAENKNSRDFINVFAKRMLEQLHHIQNTKFRQTLLQSLSSNPPETSNSKDDTTYIEETIHLAGKEYTTAAVLQRIIDISIYREIYAKNLTVWAHPKIAICIAQWISPDFAYKVSEWVHDLYLNGVVTLQEQTISSQETALVTAGKELAIMNQQLLSLQQEMENMKANQEALVLATQEMVPLREKLDQYQKRIDRYMNYSEGLEKDLEQAIAGQGVLEEQLDKSNKKKEELEEKLEDALSRIPHRVDPEKIHHILIMCVEQDWHYEVKHAQAENAMRDDKYPRDKIVMMIENVPCGTKVMNALRKMFNGPYSTMKNSGIWIKPSLTNKNVPSMSQDLLVKVVMKVVSENNVPAY